MQNIRLYKKLALSQKDRQPHATSRNLTQPHATLKKRGFSLIEVAIAIALLTLISGGALEVFSQGAIAARKSQQQAVAYSLLREKLEERSVAVPWPPTPIIEAQAPVVGFPGFEREVIITNPFLSSPDLARIRVTVWWENGSRQQTIETLKANY